jgi:integrase
MTLSVTYRKVGSKWHVRFRSRGRKEIVRTYPADYVSEREVKREVAAFQRRAAVEGWDPWAGEGGGEHVATVTEALEAWLTHLNENGSPERNLANYRSQVAVTARLGKFERTPLHLVTPEMWNKAVGMGGVSPTHQSNRATSVRRLLAWAARAGHVGEELSEAVRRGVASRKRARRVSQHLTSEQVEALCSATDPDMADFIRTLYLTGMRAAEGVAMRRSWVDMKGGWITVGDRDFRPKSGKNRSVPIPSPLVAVLERRMDTDASGQLFPTLSYEIVRKRFKKAVGDALGKAGAGISLHSLRHTYAINLIMSGFELYEIIQYTGHHSVTMLEANYADWIVRRKPDSFRERFRTL